MLILSYGFKKPQTGDRGAVFFPALEFDIQQLNDHTHDGTNSVKLTSQSINGVSQSILSAAWVATTGGTYRQAVTVPAGITVDAYAISFADAATGNKLNLSVEKIDNTHYYVYINDNTLNLTALYLV